MSGFREGDYVKTVEGLFFAVKGNRHPEDKVITYLRYIPDPDGDRTHDGAVYRRVYDLETTTKYLKEKHPYYLNHIEWLDRTLQSVPLNHIEKVFKPVEKLQEILVNQETSLEQEITRFVNRLSDESAVPTIAFGVSGSLLIELDTPESDIDLNVYGREAGLSVYRALKRLREHEDWITPYDSETIREVLNARWGATGRDLDKLAVIETRKVLHGLISGIDYFIRLVSEEVDSTKSVSRGTVTIKARVADSSDSIFTPCTYRVDDVDYLRNGFIGKVSELKSYRGKFTEQAKEGDIVEVRGTIEEVQAPEKNFFRIILGEKSDYLVPVSDPLG
ncbi:MAG: hypothetical protein NWE89_07920 [Candidatus Bathyarchaeota archaeon]|nr:hypothetical protein [Candidatus Bathyarchaeota archaeon]